MPPRQTSSDVRPDDIKIKGARTHNLKNIDLDIPRNKLVVITGLSGSGKSSLAFDTIFAEGQRRYMESLSAYARQFLSRMNKPDVDQITGLSPAISIEQKSASHNPRSTVGTITEIHDYLRLLFARVGTPHCPQHGEKLEAKTVSQMVDYLLERELDERVMLLAPVVRDRKGQYQKQLAGLKHLGFLRARIDNVVYLLDETPPLDSRRKHSVEIVVDRLRVNRKNRQRLAESIETALSLNEGLVIAHALDSDRETLLSARYACPHCGYALGEMEPRLFSFNSPAGACRECDGLGTVVQFDKRKLIRNPELGLAAGALAGWGASYPGRFKIIKALAKHYKFDTETPYKKLPSGVKNMLLNGTGNERVSLPSFRRRYQRRVFPGVIAHMQRRYNETELTHVREELSSYMSSVKCEACGGERLNESARNVRIHDHNLGAVSALPIHRAAKFFSALKLNAQQRKISEKIIDEITRRLKFLNDVGLDYLSLDRNAETLSGGEAQRIRLASQIGAGLTGVMYVLDEPSIGLHQRDNARLLSTLTRLRDLGNSVIVIEHDEATMRTADQIVDVGPGAGRYGGEIVAQGSAKQIEKRKRSLTGKYLSGDECIKVPSKRENGNGRALTLKSLSGNNLKNINVKFPLGRFICVTGVSGSGKSTLVNETLYKHVAQHLHHAVTDPAPCAGITGLEHIDGVVDIDQSPIGRTPRSNPATYTGLFTPLRELFALTPEARARAYKPGRFSFNVAGGRCEACHGDGVTRVEMHFLPDVYVSCDACKGKKYNRETLDVLYKGKTVSDVLNMDVGEAITFFDAIPKAKRKLQCLMDVGLSYITLGQNATTLSGGEAQRIKLARELSRRETGGTLYVLDEPTTGLHFHDIKQLLGVLMRLRDAGNTVIVIEHNMDVVKVSDWVIDLGPEGGDNGGRVVACGTPEQIAASGDSYTGRFLKTALNA